MAFGVPTFAQDFEPGLPDEATVRLDHLAARAAARVRQSSTDPVLPRVLVIDFSNASDRRFTKLGAVLAERFSKLLANHADHFTVEDRDLFSRHLRENFVDLTDLQGEGVTLALARFIGASGIVGGDVREDPDRKLLLTLRLEGFGAVWSAGEVLPLTAQMRALLNEAAPGFARRSVPAPFDSDVPTAGTNGVGVPECVYCPPPLLTEAASLAKYSGAITLSVTVTAGGTAESIFVLRGAPFQMNQQAIEAVRKWKFKPAEKNRKPVSARVPIEMTFRIN